MACLHKLYINIKYCVVYCGKVEIIFLAPSSSHKIDVTTQFVIQDM